MGPWKITYHPQSGWFEDTPLKGGTEEGCPLKGVHEGTFPIEAGHPAWNHSRASGLTVVLRLGLVYGLGSGLPHKTSSTPPQRRNGRACSSLTARGGGLPVGVISATLRTLPALHDLFLIQKGASPGYLARRMSS